MIYIAYTGAPSADTAAEGTPLLAAPQAPLEPPPGFARLSWYLRKNEIGWGYLWWTGLWAGLLFLELNYLWYLGLPMPGMLPSEASAAANSSFAWVYVLSIFMLNESIDWVKVLAVIGTLAGVVLLALSTLENGEVVHGKKRKATFSVGIIIEFCCAASQAFYFVAFRKWAVRKGRLPALISAMITGFMGLAHLLFFWPGFIIFNYADWWVVREEFTMPSRQQFAMLALGATITSTGCIALMLGIALLPNPLIVSVATLVTTPAQYVADSIFHPEQTRSMGTFNIAGGVIIVATFATIIARDYYLIQSRSPTKFNSAAMSVQ